VAPEFRQRADSLDPQSRGDREFAFLVLTIAGERRGSVSTRWRSCGAALAVFTAAVVESANAVRVARYAFAGRRGRDQ